MAAPVSEVRGRSREDDPGQALQVFHAWAGGEYHDRVQVRSVEHIVQNTGAPECEENEKLLSINKVQFNPDIILC